jgi:hypothetical protein
VLLPVNPKLIRVSTGTMSSCAQGVAEFDKAVRPFAGYIDDRYWRRKKCDFAPPVPDPEPLPVPLPDTEPVLVAIVYLLSMSDVSILPPNINLTRYDLFYLPLAR